MASWNPGEAGTRWSWARCATWSLAATPDSSWSSASRTARSSRSSAGTAGAGDDAGDAGDAEKASTVVIVRRRGIVECRAERAAPTSVCGARAGPELALLRIGDGREQDVRRERLSLLEVPREQVDGGPGVRSRDDGRGKLTRVHQAPPA